MTIDDMMLFPNTNPYSGKMVKVKNLRNWMIDTATVLFDDNHNDLRTLPKTVRLQLLVVLSFVWSTVFTVYFFSIATMLWGWVGLVVGHLGIIFAMYYTFKQFHNIKKQKYSWGYHSYGRGREYVIMRDKKGNPYKVKLPAGDPGGEHE